jgi:hypothetical protein
MWWKICKLSAVIHPGGGPSGVVPGVVASDRGLSLIQRCSGEGLDYFFNFLSEVLLVNFQDSCAINTKVKALLVIAPTA